MLCKLPWHLLSTTKKISNQTHSTVSRTDLSPVCVSWSQSPNASNLSSVSVLTTFRWASHGYNMAEMWKCLSTVAIETKEKSSNMSCRHTHNRYVLSKRKVVCRYCTSAKYFYGRITYSFFIYTHLWRIRVAHNKTGQISTDGSW